MSPQPGAVVRVVADLGERTVITVEDFARLVGISRSAAYEAARRGDFPVRRVGRRLFVPVPALRRWLGVDLDADTSEDVPASEAVGEERVRGRRNRETTE